MNGYQLPLRVELAVTDGKAARLIDGFAFADPDHGPVHVPAGFDTDFASVKPLRTIACLLLALSLAVGWFWPEVGAAIGTAGYGALALYSSVVGYGNAAAVIHDWLYSTGELGRSAADHVFYNALRSSGIARWRAWLMWAGVRIGGATKYRRG